MISKEKNIKICFVSAGLAGGGMERSLTNIANYAAGQGYEVTILNLFKTDVFFDLHPEITLIWPEIDRASTHRLLYAAQLIPYIRKQLKQLKPDTVLSFGEWFNAYVIMATRFLGIPVFVSDRMGPLLNLGFLLESARKIMYRFASGIISQTSIARKIVYKKTWAKNIIVIPNALNVIDTDTAIKKNQIVTVGRLSREKGQAVLIRAFAALEVTDWSLHIVGDGRERANLEILVSELKISDRVHFYGHLKNFNTILGQSDIFVLPSLYEGFPNALIEAMSVPLACICSDCVAGPSDIIQHGDNGFLFEPGNEKRLTELMGELIQYPQVRNNLAKNAFKVRQELALNKIADRYLAFILQGLQNKK